MNRPFTNAQWDDGLLALHKSGIPAIIDFGREGYFYRLTGSDRLAYGRRVIDSPHTAQIIATRRKWGIKP